MSELTIALIQLSLSMDASMCLSSKPALVQKRQFGPYLCGADVIADDVKLTKVRVLHAEVGAVSCHLASLFLQVCQLLAVVVHLQQHEGRVSRRHAVWLDLLPARSKTRDAAQQLTSLCQQSGLQY